MKKLIWLSSTTLILSMSMLATCQAQEINQPKSYLPNDIANKVTNVRLRGLVAEDEINELLDDQFSATGLRDIQQLGCNVNIGNTTNTGTSIDKDVVVVGDVINFCQ